MAGAGIRGNRWRRLPWLLSAALHLALLSLIGLYRWQEPAEVPPPIAVRLVPLAALSPPAPAAPAPPSAEAVAPPAAEAAPPSEANLAPPAPVPAPEQELAAQPPPAPKPQAASNAPAPPPAVAAPIVTPEMQEMTREGFPGMKTAPLTRSAPLTAAQWNKLDETYHLGTTNSGSEVEPTQGPRRAAASKRAPPLTKEQWAALDRIYHVGKTDQFGATVQGAALRAAASERAPRLTREQWAALDKIYFVGAGDSGRDVVAADAGLRGALSITAAVNAPAQAVEYGYGSALRRGAGGIAARAIEQPMPEITTEIGRELTPTGGTLVAVARFAVAADGTAKVDLTGPTPAPKLNEVLLAALQKWRFTPAYQGGSPVASTLEVRLTISAR
jgi:outer membrane biosynthesis protein TonB